jgi:hypothetical protein
VLLLSNVDGGHLYSGIQRACASHNLQPLHAGLCADARAQALTWAVVGKLPVAPGVLTAELQGSNSSSSSFQRQPSLQQNAVDLSRTAELLQCMFQTARVPCMPISAMQHIAGRYKANPQALALDYPKAAVVCTAA